MSSGLGLVTSGLGLGLVTSGLGLGLVTSGLVNIPAFFQIIFVTKPLIYSRL